MQIPNIARGDDEDLPRLGWKVGGNPAEDTLRLSAHALVWTRDGITYRLESTSRSLEESVALAESMD